MSSTTFVARLRDLYVPQARFSSPVALTGNSAGQIAVASSPEALRSAAGCVVPPPQTLLWPHPSHSWLSRAYGFAPRVFAFSASHERFPNLFCACVPTCRLPYPDRPSGCSWLLLHRSYKPPPSLHGLGIHILAFRGCKVRFMLRPAGLLTLQKRIFTLELSPKGSPPSGVEYNYAG